MTLTAMAVILFEVSSLLLLLRDGTAVKAQEIEADLTDLRRASLGEFAPAMTSPSTPPLKEGEVLVLNLQENGVPSNMSYARLITPFPELRTFTVCYRIRLNRFREESTLMSYAISEKKDNELRMDHRLTGYMVSLHSIWAKTKIHTPLRVWSHFCYRYNYITGKWDIFMDGDLQGSGNFPRKTYPLEGKGTYIIGQEQDSVGGGFQGHQSYSGEITELNFWSKEIDDETIKAMALCQLPEVGDALPWTGQSWKIDGDVRWVALHRDDICDHRVRRVVIFPDRFPLTPARHHCRVLGGIIAVPQTKADNKWVFDSSKDRAPYCSGNAGASYLWLGSNDIEEEGTWRYWESNEELQWQSTWRGDGPNGGTAENCMVMLAGNFAARWSDIACLETYTFCVPCEFERLKVLYLKGPAVCPESPFNLHYLLGEEIGGRPSLVGFFHSDIYWDTSMKAWLMKSIKGEDMAWWKPPEEGMYPFGLHSWTLGSKVCGLLQGETVNMTISMCGEGKFTCGDGSCIELQHRCDLRVDCPDQSDEARCLLVDIPKGYRVTIPPSPVKVTETLPIFFTINIISFPSIETEDLTFVTSLELKLRWQDTRLTFLNLKDDRSLNVLSQASVSSIWKPRVFFSNAQGNVFTNLDEGAKIECVRLGEPRTGPPHFTEEVNLFSGKENSLEMTQLYSVTYTCDFDLLMFPFDAQVCELRFTLVSATTSYMEMIPVNASYTGSPNLIEYSIGQVSTKKITEGEFSSVEVEVRFRRRYGFYMLTLYIPTTLLIVTAYATFFFNPYDFNSRIVVALTSLLVLSSLYTQTSNSLPKTSYFKLVDIWLFFSIVMIFIVVLVQTLIDFSAQVELPQSSFLNKVLRKIFRKKMVGMAGLDMVKPIENFKPNCVPIQVEGHQVSSPPPGDSPVAKVDCWHDRRDMTSAWPDHAPGTISGHSPYLKGTYVPGQTAPVNVPMMVKSRILIPAIFFLFNAVYWGIAFKYLNNLGEDMKMV